MTRRWPRQSIAVPWDGASPEAAAERLAGRRWFAWLDSSLAGPEPGGRWSVLASDPRWTLVAGREDLFLEDASGPRRLPPGALHALASGVEAEQASPPNDGLDLPFRGGAIGYLGFELGREVERLPATTLDDVGAPVLAFGWYDAALCWDHREGRGWLVGCPPEVEALRYHLAQGHPSQAPLRLAATAPAALRPNMSRDRYLAAVERARRYIEAGDIYQVNLAQRFSLPLEEDGYQVYRRLRRVSPAPHAAYLDVRSALGDIEVLSSSPERFLLADGDLLETRPIKGTRPRGVTSEADARMRADLLASAKDRAEHVMIVDLERNDLGRVAEVGSVHVPSLAALESYAQVHHLVSTVRARRRPGAALEALLRATFPGGSISGAPKIRALEVIDELEPHVRGVYTGSIGYISAHGRLDLNIAIRTIALVDGVAHFHVGGAIVHDSEPEAEYTETLDKARGMARALGVALPDETPEPAAAVR